jgi:superfamily II DNA/RNA helicase
LLAVRVSLDNRSRPLLSAKFSPNNLSPSRFSELGVPARAVSSLAARGIVEPFPIQAAAIPPALAGRDVCGRAPTGSGKTIAFGIPMAERVRPARPGRPRGLVLVPTRELAGQITDELRLLHAPYKRRVAAFYGGVGFGPQLKALRSGVDVAVACPGRLSDLLRRGSLALDDVDVVVIDEADRLADMGFLPDVRAILDQVSPQRQVLLFSATLDGDVDILTRRYQTDPAHCEIAPAPEGEGRTTHHFLPARREERIRITAELVASHGATVVFCRTKHGVDRVAAQLKEAGVKVASIHGGRTQPQRDRAMRTFAAGKANALVATDVAARGIHIDNVACVVHFDVAGDHKDYIHRSGRTGRAGAAGVVVTLVADADRIKVRRLQKALNLPGEVVGSGSVEPSSGVGVSGPSPRRGRGRAAPAGRRGSGSSADPRRRGRAVTSGRAGAPARPGRVGRVRETR